MFYFDVRPCLKRMTREQQGELFCAILDYGEFGTEPEFSDPAIYFAWDFIKPRLDNDDKAYKNKCEKAKEAVEKRWSQSEKDDTDECERIQLNTDECERNNPIPTTNSDSSLLPPSNTNNIISCASKGEKESKAKYHPDWFDRFWALYPKKKSKKDAIKAWDKLKPSLELCKIMDAALRKQMTWKQWQDPQFIPLPGTWIRGENWNDEDIYKLEKKPEGALVDWDNDDIFLK